MCGICGYTGLEDKALVHRMIDSMRHRGPDDRGVFIDGATTLGNCRLAIIDLSMAARQPMSNEDKTVWVTYNGEIYNHKALKKELEISGHVFCSHSDTEVIVHGYEEWGLEVFSRLDGMFALAIKDKRTGKLILARDRLGIKPLFYAITGKTLLFASEIKSLLQYDGLKKEINIKALDYYMTFRYSPIEETMIKNIFKLEPGFFAIWEDSVLRKRRYWDLHFNIQKMGLGDISLSIKNNIEESVSGRLMSDVPLGIFLSGGIDSNLILGSMAGVLNREIEAFSVGFGVEGYKDESLEAERAREYYNLNFHRIIIGHEGMNSLLDIIGHLGEPNADPSIVPTYFMSKLACRKIKVVLTGEGGDELFGGYERDMLVHYSGKYPGIFSLNRQLMAFLIKLLPRRMYNSILRHQINISTAEIDRLVKYFLDPDNIPRKYVYLTSVFSDLEKDDLFVKNVKNQIEPGSVRRETELYITTRAEGDTIFQKMLYYEIKTRLCNDLLAKLDSMTMAHSLEGRVPFLSHKLVEYSATIPDGFKIRNFMTKYCLREAARFVLPKEISHRPKRHFIVPVGFWLKNYMKPLIRTFLSRQFISEQDLFAFNSVKELLKKMDQDSVISTRQIWTLLFFQLWYAKNILDIDISGIE